MATSLNQQQELVGSFTRFEASFRAQYPIAWFTTLVAPVVVTLLLLGTIGWIYGWDYSGKLVSHALLTFFVFGRFIILSGTNVAESATQILLSPEELFLLVTYMDFMAALFVTFHLGFLFKLPWVGEKLAMLVWDGKFLMDSQPWLKRVAFGGLVGLVIFPTSTTGSIGGSIFGRLLGLSRFATVGGVLLGSILGNGLMYFMSDQINKYLDKDSDWLKIVGIILIVVLFFALERRYQQVRKRYLKRQGIESDDSPQ